MNVLATFVRKLANKNFRKSPHLVTLLTTKNNEIQKGNIKKIKSHFSGPAKFNTNGKTVNKAAVPMGHITLAKLH